MWSDKWIEISVVEVKRNIRVLRVQRLECCNESKERPSIEFYKLLVWQNKWSVLWLFFGTSKFLTKSNVPQKKRTERHLCLPLLDWPIAWFCASIPSQHHCSSLLSHSYWTGHRDWALGMRRNMSYNMILCLYHLSTSLCSSLLSHSHWTVDTRIELFVSSLLQGAVYLTGGNLLLRLSFWLL